MARYIDAEKLYKGITDGDFTTGNIFRDMELLEFIKELPTADVVEVVHGEWIYIDGDVGYSQVKCSRCEKMMVFGDEDELYHYCLDCGAKMDGKKVE